MNIDDVIEMLTDDDFDTAAAMIGKCGGKIEEPDLVIAPDGNPYLFRWHLLPHQGPAGCYFHIQIGSDPQHLHDHPWDNTSVILAGGYREMMQVCQRRGAEPRVVQRHVGNVIFRRAHEAHRLILPPEFPYAMTVFTVGPKVREWGYWYPDGWHSHKRHNVIKNGISVHFNRGSVEL